MTVLLRHALGLAAAATLLAALGAALSFLVAGAALTTAEEVRAVTLRVGIVLLLAFLIFALTLGAATRWLLGRMGRRDAPALAAGGAAAGHLFALVAVALAPPGGPAYAAPALAGFLALVGAALLPLARRLARAMGVQ
ncbi:MAG: hypothetical protein R6V44_07935 [Paracoccaceae bacterium]